MGVASPVVSFVVPARNEAGYLGDTLDSIGSLDSDVSYEVLVVDGDSDDDTRDVARRRDVRLVHGCGDGRGAGRHVGAEHAAGDWFAFLDADTRVREGYLDRMLEFVHENGLEGAGSECIVEGPVRSLALQALFNRVLPSLSPPVFPGFNVFVDRTAYFDVGGFPTGPNEDVTFSRKLGQHHSTATCPDVLVETSGRRIERRGLLGAVLYYWRLEARRQWRVRTGSAPESTAGQPSSSR